MSLNFLSQSDILLIAQGTGRTVALALLAMAFGSALGAALGLLRFLVWRPFGALIGGVMNVFRSVPLLIQLVLFNSIASILGFGGGAFVIAVVVLSLYAAAFCAELVYGGLLSVHLPTRHAARALGMSLGQELLYVSLPIAARVALPNWINLGLGVLKDTSLVLWIGIIELLRASQIITARTQEPLILLGIAGAIYFLLSFPLSRLSARIERNWSDQ